MKTFATTNRRVENDPACFFARGHNKELPDSENAPPLSSSAPMIQRKASCACGGGCPACQSSLPLQAKLKIGQPNNMYEQEADRVADQVMRMPDPLIQRKPG